MPSVIILHHHEITLKGQNRKLFEIQLLRNCKQAVDGLLQRWQFSGGYGRFVIELSENDEQNKIEIIERLRKVFGLANLGVGISVKNEIENDVNKNVIYRQDSDIFMDKDLDKKKKVNIKVK